MTVVLGSGLFVALTLGVRVARTVHNLAFAGARYPHAEREGYEKAKTVRPSRFAR